MCGVGEVPGTWPPPPPLAPPAPDSCLRRPRHAQDNPWYSTTGMKNCSPGTHQSTDALARGDPPQQSLPLRLIVTVRAVLT